MTCQVFRGCTQRYLRIENLKTDFRPLSNRLQLDTTVDERLCKLSSMGTECVCADDDGSWGFVGFEEGLSFAGWEEVEELVC